MGKRVNKNYKCGVGEAVIETPKFAKLLGLNTLRFTNRKLANGAFVWGFDDGYIVTSNDPFTGTFMDGSRTQIGVMGAVGVQGTKSFRDRVAKFLKRNAIMDTFLKSDRAI